MSEQYVALSLYISVIGFVAIFLLAFTNKVIVFYDEMDLVWSLMIVIGPLLSFGALVIANIDDNPSATDFFVGGPVQIFISACGVAFAIYGVLKTYQASIICNGVGVGIAVGTFRVIAAILILLSVFGFLSRLLEKKGRSAGTVMVAMIFFGIFAWIVSVLINGDRVADPNVGPSISLMDIFLVLAAFVGITGGVYWFVYLSPVDLDMGRVLRLVALGFLWVVVWKYWRKVFQSKSVEQNRLQK